MSGFMCKIMTQSQILINFLTTDDLVLYGFFINLTIAVTTY